MKRSVSTPTSTERKLTLCLCVIPSDLADTLLLEASTHATAYITAAFELGCQERVCFFLWLSGMIQNSVMIKLAGGEELSGARRSWQIASRRLSYCHCALNNPHERAPYVHTYFACAGWCLCVGTNMVVCSVPVMSVYITSYFWVEWHVGSSADGRNRNSFHQRGSGAHVFDVRVKESYTRWREEEEESPQYGVIKEMKNQLALGSPCLLSQWCFFYLYYDDDRTAATVWTDIYPWFHQVLDVKYGRSWPCKHTLHRIYTLLGNTAIALFGGVWSSVYFGIRHSNNYVLALICLVSGTCQVRTTAVQTRVCGREDWQDVWSSFCLASSSVRSLPGEPQRAGHPQTGGLQDRTHAPRSPGANRNRVSMTADFRLLMKD